MPIIPLPSVSCHFCGTVFKAKKTWQKFCKPKCRDDWHNQHRDKDGKVNARVVTDRDIVYDIGHVPTIK